LSGVVPDDDRIAGVMTDWQGRIWFVTAGVGEDTAKACVLNPATYPDVKCQPLGENDPTTGKHEKIFNTFAVTKTGAYVVTSKKMHRVWAGSDDDPYVVWSEPYATIDEVRPGQYELGSGTSPTILGEGKYVAITDNAEQLQVVVFRTDERLGPKETRKVCEVPVFDFEGGGAGALSNSLIGSRLSLIVENTYDYAMYWQQDGKKPSAPGFERIDINPNGKGCTKVWSSPHVASTISGKLSTRTGLIYIYARKMDTSKVDVEHPYGLDVYYLTALDFRTGEVVWEKQVGTGFTFDHYYTALLVGPDETVYFGLHGGIVSVRDLY
jgi:outer membrane protein assembly factor BamB